VQAVGRDRLAFEVVQAPIEGLPAMRRQLQRTMAPAGEVADRRRAGTRPFARREPGTRSPSLRLEACPAGISATVEAERSFEVAAAAGSLAACATALAHAAREQHELVSEIAADWIQLTIRARGLRDARRRDRAELSGLAMQLLDLAARQSAPPRPRAARRRPPAGVPRASRTPARPDRVAAAPRAA
jgi:hypothetical protein